MSRLVLALVVAGASAQLTLDGVRCGQLLCQQDQYCSPETNRCAPCSLICNTTHHNYDAGLCVKECQGYLLDLRYMRRSQGPESTTDYGSVERQARAALILSAVALAVLLLALVLICRAKFSWRYIKQKFQPTKNRVKQYPATGLTHHNPHAEMPKPKPELKLDISNPEPLKRPQPLNARDLETRTSQTEKSQGATTPKTMSTALSNRHPAEDTTLDFSYDNMALNVTPPERATTTHKF
ncbi:protein grindelwald [Cydia strobilella]|uniref:protein grindelwald n=1 Tax=Cydia strobilella TaxID=1100964 RepID=UPI00300602A9